MNCEEALNLVNKTRKQLANFQGKLEANKEARAAKLEAIKKTGINPKKLITARDQLQSEIDAEMLDIEKALKRISDKIASAKESL